MHGRPLLSGILLALLTLAQVASAAHQLTGAHQTCEHGQVVEADDGPASLAQEVGEQDGAHLLASEEARAEAHVHCLAWALLRSAAACPAALPVVAGLSAQHALPTAADARAIPREVLLLMAPKSSPPA